MCLCVSVCVYVLCWFAESVFWSRCECSAVSIDAFETENPAGRGQEEEEEEGEEEEGRALRRGARRANSLAPLSPKRDPFAYLTHRPTPSPIGPLAFVSPFRARAQERESKRDKSKSNCLLARGPRARTRAPVVPAAAGQGGNLGRSLGAQKNPGGEGCRTPSGYVVCRRRDCRARAPSASPSRLPLFSLARPNRQPNPP